MMKWNVLEIPHSIPHGIFLHFLLRVHCKLHHQEKGIDFLTDSMIFIESAIDTQSNQVFSGGLCDSLSGRIIIIIFYYFLHLVQKILFGKLITIEHVE